MPVVSYLWTRCIYTQRVQRSQRSYSQRSRPLKTARGCRLLTRADETAPSIPPSPTYPRTRRRTVPPTLHPVFRIARTNRREGQWSLSANKFTVARRTSDIHALDKLHEGSERGDSRDVCAVNVGAENVPSVAIYNLLLHARTADQLGEPCGLFGGNSLRGAIDLTAAHQDAAAHVADGLNPAGHGDSGATKTCGVIRGEAGAPLDRGRMDQYIRSRTDWKQRVVLRLAWITASCWSEIVALTPNNSTLEADGAIILDWSVAPRTARADPHRAFRFVRMRGQDALDTIKLCRTLRRNEKLTNLTAAHVERALAPWNATAHSIKRGALRHAAPIVETHDLDPHVISPLAVHVDPFDIPQDTVRYLGRYTTMLTQVSSLVALM
ncbi:hypothetical protein TCDM_08700 [Trypanosoma cruzi Dm28c]|uniref:Trans-sialidase n=1 Tax=Trypanosoma cruzi Dm28c TaxID=1416333 RepID=V5B753_TRYCR|nr:hypothetical protein TCDM_08700 [Trypanosoma cruzi Dm28c]